MDLQFTLNFPEARHQKPKGTSFPEESSGSDAVIVDTLSESIWNPQQAVWVPIFKTDPVEDDKTNISVCSYR